MASNRFMAYLERIYAAVEGKGRVVWHCDLSKFKPNVPNAHQHPETWIARWEPDPSDRHSFAVVGKGCDGQMALGELLAGILRAKPRDVEAEVDAELHAAAKR